MFDLQGNKWIEKDSSLHLPNRASGWRNPRIPNILNGKSWNGGTHNPHAALARCSDAYEASWMNMKSHHLPRPPNFVCSSGFGHHGSAINSCSMSSHCSNSTSSHLPSSAETTHTSSHMHSSSSLLNPSLPQELSWEDHCSYGSKTIGSGFLGQKDDMNSYSRVPNQPVYRSRLTHDARGFQNLPSNTSSDKLDSYFGPDCNSASSISRRRASSQLGPHLMQSRHNFQTALDSACKDSVIDAGVKASADLMDDDDVDIFPSVMSCSSNQFYQWQKHGCHPLVEMRTHQADMQQQARDFLDELDQCNHPKQCPRQTFSQAMFAEARPPSHDPGSAFMRTANARSKDLSVKVGSYM
ncbi:hypothetical protein PoB_000265600 [Plakobranchus ocellatus]|uniref:Uncharacterized protein n=1 Tax=Plakobranchus ocellatus TaxID=259542 RepID=A0AAV3Y1C2_9GAST|nr:hypothetical protein PoB_000265600 [Plakobranchus ocellatus]